MPGRLLVLTGGAAVSGDLTLPLVGAAATPFAPTSVGFPSATVSLPLVGAAASAIAPTTVKLNQSAALPLVGAAASAFAPTITSKQILSLPLAGPIATPFGPRLVPYLPSGSPVTDPDLVELTLHSSTGTLIRTLSKFRSFRFVDPLKVSSPGRGELVLQRLIEAGAANPSLTGLEHNTIIRVSVGGETAWQMRVEDLSHALIGPSEEAGQTTTAAGRHAVLAELDQVRVYPDAGLSIRPWGTTRYFNGSSRNYVTTALPLAVATPPHYDTAVPNYGRPEGFPDFTAQWIWDRSSHVNVPAGDCYFWHDFTVASATDALVIAAADDEVEVWMDGVPILQVEGVYKGGSLRAEVELSATTHRIFARGRNLNALHAGILVTVMTVTDSMPDVVLTNTQASTWKVLGYPTQAPGFAWTQVLRQLVTEAQARSELVGMATSFLDSHDTDGEPVVTSTDIACRLGDSYLTVCGQLAETFADIAGASASRTLHAWIRGTRGTNVAASYTKGTNLLELRHEGHSDAQATVAFVQYAGGAPFERVHADAATYGRKVVSLEFGDVRSLTLARSLADAYLNTASRYRNGVVAGILPTLDADRPYRGVWPGDSPMVPAADLTATRTRVAVIGMDLDANSRPKWSMEFEQPSEVDNERLGAIMRRQLPGAAGGRTLLPSPISPQFLPTSQGREATHTWQYKGAIGAPSVFVLRKNGTPITGATISVVVGETEQLTVTNSARRYVKNSDKLTFTADGGTASLEWAPTEGRFIQAFKVTADATGAGATVDVWVT